jgi:ketopantoate reductase
MIVMFIKTQFAGLGMVLVCSSAVAQHKLPTEAQCRQMVASAIQVLKSTKLETERDKKDAKALLERIEKILKDNRSRGASECESWDAIGTMATRQ